MTPIAEWALAVVCVLAALLVGLSINLAIALWTERRARHDVTSPLEQRRRRERLEYRP